MIKLDSKDKKILYHLSLDSRQSLKTISKKAGVSKELAAYRIKRLFKKEIITNYAIFINIEKLGYSSIFIYYYFTKVNPILKEKIIDYLVKNEYIWYVSLLEGAYDLEVSYLVGNPFEYESLMDDIHKKFHKYLKYKYATTFIRGEDYNFPFLINDKINITKPKKFSWGSKLIYIDELDFQILQILSRNPREQIKVIANNLKSTISIVNYRIKKLIKENIIYQYSININWPKLGYRFYHLRLYLNDYSKKNLIINYIRKNPYLKNIYKDLVYSIDIPCTFLLHNTEQFREIIEDLTLNFPDDIDRCECHIAYKICKATNMVPKLLNINSPLKKEA